jgi:hypothetical protein
MLYLGLSKNVLSCARVLSSKFPMSNIFFFYTLGFFLHRNCGESHVLTSHFSQYLMNLIARMDHSLVIQLVLRRGFRFIVLCHGKRLAHRRHRMIEE